MITASLSGEIKLAIGTVVTYVRVILFGSRARGTHDSRSDYDILVITPTEFSPAEKLPIKTSIRKKMQQLGLASDILIQSETEINSKSQLPGHVIKTILTEGVTL